MGYFSRHWQRAFCFKSLPFQIDRWLFSVPTGWKFSFGLWVRYTVDNAGTPPSTFSGGGFQYTSLESGQVRLLKIHRGNSDDIVVTTLVTADLLEAPPYEALSYVWGAYKKRASLTINGYAVQIHAGLFDAIHTLRSPTSERWIWADAICINQDDLYERQHQVSIMGEIYKTAYNVAVYLGQPNERSEEGMKVLHYFTKMNNSVEDPPWLFEALPETVQNLAEILNRPWFSRIWTVQEATLAQQITFVCGKDQVSWRGDLRTMRSIVFRIKAAAISPHFSSATQYTSMLDWTPLLNVLETQMRQAARREGVTLFRNHVDLAFDFRHRQSNDPRDKYFAVLGIIENDQGGQLNLAPDYSTTLEQLHRKFTAEIQRIGKIEGLQIRDTAD